MKEKKFILFLLIVSIATYAKAQSWSTGTNILHTNPIITYVGIGDNSLVDKLTIRDGNLSLLRTNDAEDRIISARTSSGSMYLMAGTHNSNKGGYIQLFGNTHPAKPNAITFTAPETLFLFLVLQAARRYGSQFHSANCGNEYLLLLPNNFMSPDYNLRS